MLAEGALRTQEGSAGIESDDHIGHASHGRGSQGQDQVSTNTRSSAGNFFKFPSCSVDIPDSPQENNTRQVHSDIELPKKGKANDNARIAPFTLPRAAGLTRQCPVQKNSNDSSSEKTDSGSKLTASLDSATGENISFQSICKRQVNDDANGCDQGSIVVPKAKVDKTTQVSASEITKETGWDLIEKIYVFLMNMDLRTVVSNKQASHQTHEFGNQQKCSTKSEHRNSLPNDANLFRSNTSQGIHHYIMSGPNLQDTRYEGVENAAVNAWFDRNEIMLRPSRQRLGTMETVDSGFDDHLAFHNRHARLSLPTLKTGTCDLDSLLLTCKLHTFIVVANPKVCIRCKQC